MEWPDKDSTLSFADLNEPFKLYTDSYFKGLEVVFCEEKMRKRICVLVSSSKGKVQCLVYDVELSVMTWVAGSIARLSWVLWGSPGLQL